MVFDPRPLVSLWAQRKAKADARFREERQAILKSMLVFFLLLPFFPDGLVIIGFVIYWIWRLSSPRY